ncbi:MAG: BON domain-containing protein [Planctomycetota bacterium]|nr:BON domain-containing protein [Planctomycetota bacterium]
MPRLLVIGGAVLAVLTSFAAVRADDAQIARQITAQLRQQQMNQGLQGFRIGVQVSEGTVTMLGQVSSPEQGQLALDTARRVPGVRLVVNDLKVREMAGAPVVAPVESAQPVYAAAANMPTMPVARHRNSARAALPPHSLAQPRRIATAPRPAVAMSPQAIGRPRAFAPSQIPIQLVSNVVEGGMVGPECMGGGPVPATMPSHMGGGAQQAMHDNPNMPGYAWPSYASYPNYGAVSYPKQYSPSAWPYIGPFYPYPQVPLGWRKVMLEWDDGWWWLDFKSK